MQLAKKVHDCFLQVEAEKLKEVLDEPAVESAEIDQLLEGEVKESRVSLSQKRHKLMLQKRHVLNLDEALNIVKNSENLPFKLPILQFQRLEADLERHDKLKKETDQLLALKDVPPLNKYDKILIELNELLFVSPTLVKVREIFDNCSYIMEMTQQFIPDKLPEDRISEFITIKQTLSAQKHKDGKRKEYQMFAPEFEHVIKLMDDGLHFECPQAQDLKNIYTVYKGRYET